MKTSQTGLEEKERQERVRAVERERDRRTRAAADEKQTRNMFQILLAASGVDPEEK